jgi:hypothetical protein
VLETKQNDWKKKPVFSVRKVVSCLFHYITIKCNLHFTGQKSRTLCTCVWHSFLVRKLEEKRQIVTYRRKLKDNIKMCLVTRLFQRFNKTLIPNDQSLSILKKDRALGNIRFNYYDFARQFLAVTSPFPFLFLNWTWTTQKVIVCTVFLIHIGNSELSSDFFVYLCEV